MSSTKVIGLVIGVVTLIASGAYVFVYLYRWEWNRALISGVIFLAAELALIGWLLNGRIRTVGGEVERLREQRIRQHVRAAAPASRNHFAWLERQSSSMNVFVPLLLGAGVLVSAIAWLVERVAGATARPVLERDLTRRLGALAVPAKGFIVDDDPVDLIARPSPR
jgi:hypothetical protein